MLNAKLSSNGIVCDNNSNDIGLFFTRIGNFLLLDILNSDEEEEVIKAFSFHTHDYMYLVVCCFFF